MKKSLLPKGIAEESNNLPKLTPNEETAIRTQVKEQMQGLSFGEVVNSAIKGVMKVAKGGKAKNLNELIEMGLEETAVDIARKEKAIALNNSKNQIQLTDGGNSTSKED